jgi:hypothetical protein
MSKNAKIKRSQKLFLAAMKKKFTEDDNATSKVFPEQSPKDHVTLLPAKSCKPDPFDEEADRKYDRMINSIDDWEMDGYRRK